MIARQLAVAAWAVFPTGEAASAITTLLAEQQQQGVLPAGAPLQTGAGPNGGVSAVAFSPSGKLLASAGADGTVRLWQVSVFAHPYAALCAYVGPPTPQEWNQYASGEPQPKVCG